jgi:hypothetical protein
MTATIDLDPDTRYAIGLDIGDGESCLLWLDAGDPMAEARIYERTKPVERAVLTALARRRGTGELVFGEAALLAGDAVQFVVNVKRPPDASLTPDVVLFAQAFLEEFFQAHPEVRASCQILVGYPTGWPSPARDAYLRFLQTSDVPLALLPESQSALVHVWDRRRRLDRIGQQQNVDNVLVVDIGSSTVDVTMVTDLNPVNIELGAELGCRDIDEELARMVSAALAGDPGFSRAMEQADAPMLLRLACRRAKETQFSGQSLRLHDLPDALNPRMTAIVELVTGWLRAQDIPHLVEQSWAVRFRDLMIEVREKLARPPEVVVLTGGGSRMPVTRRVCSEVFPEATPELDDAPSFSVGRGLASAARHRIQALRFRRDATGVASTPEVTSALRKATVAAFTAVRDHTLEALRRTDPENWKSVIEPPPGLQEAARDLEEAVDRTVRPLVNQVCDTYKIPGGQRALDTRLAPPRLFTVDFVNRVLSMPARPDLELGSFEGAGPAVAQIILRSASKGANNAVLTGAAGIAARLRGGVRSGGKAALIIGAGYVALVGSIWTAETIIHRRKRNQVLAELAAMELPDEAVTVLEQELTQEVARVVGERIAPLERMVR